jgi:acyl-CoA reductase-like NAD-dependent aldehyde dehydrogenase
MQDAHRRQVGRREDGATLNDKPRDNGEARPRAEGGQERRGQGGGAARAAFPAWSKKTQAQRGAVLKNIAARLRENANELALCDMREHGNPNKDAVGICMGAADKFD